MTGGRTYTRDPGWETRMSLNEELFDPLTIEYLERLGVAASWHVLELGAGRGSIAVWLAERVGPSGRVVATDLDTRDLEALEVRSLEVLRHDVLADDFPDASFDLVHCRGVLVHVRDPDRALERMVRWLRPGGLLLAEEPWHDVGLLSPDPVAARAARALREDQGMNTDFARRMPAALREAGLDGVEGEGKLTFFEGGTKPASFYRFVLRGAAVRLVASGELDRTEVERMTARFDDRDWLDCGWPRIVAWGRKPS
jgi:SAM-dependent methyltransferase